jgi:hypothetical protein
METKTMIKTFTILISLFLVFSFSLMGQEDLALANTKKNNNTGTKIDNNIKKELVEAPNDTLRAENQISFIYNDGEQYFLKLRMKAEVEVKIEVFNMLAKPVKTIYEGKASVDPDRLYEFNASTLPNGIYFAILQGNGFRHPYKFTIRR